MVSSGSLFVNGPVYAVAADLNNDHLLDVVSANYYDGKLVIFLANAGSSPPTFTPQVVSSNVYEIWSVRTADLDGDLDIDILGTWLDSGGAAGRWTLGAPGAARALCHQTPTPLFLLLVCCNGLGLQGSGLPS